MLENRPGTHKYENGFPYKEIRFWIILVYNAMAILCASTWYV